MGRTPCCSKVGLHRGAWSSDEDKLLISHIQTHGEGQWRALPSKAGLLRCGKSCRLRWMNYLRPGIKRGNFTSDENDAIFRLRSLHGNRWSLIAAELPGRTDNEIKNYWNAHLRKTLQTHHPKPSRTTKKLQKNKKSAAEHEHAQKEHKSTEVKLLESGPMSSNSSSLPSLCSSGASSSCTVDVGGGEFEFPWSNWSPFMEGEEGECLLMDGWDLVSSKGDESLMFENLYHEYLNLLNDQEGVDEDNSN